MTEREKSEICKGYADLIIKKEKLIREIWETIKQYEEYVNAVKYWQSTIS